MPDDVSMAKCIEAFLASGNTRGVLEAFKSLGCRADAAIEEADQLGERVRKLELQTKHLRRLLYGRRSEKLTQEELMQLSLLFGGDGGDKISTPAGPEDKEPPAHEAEPTDPKPKPKKRRPNHHGRRPLPPNLERIVVDSCVSEEDRICSHCDDPMCTFGWVEREWVERVAAKFVVHVERCEKVGCRNNVCPGEAVTAERLTTSNLPSRVGVSVLAHLIESKCDDSMPIYRIRESYKRLGFDVPLSTLYRYWTYPLDLLVPVAEVTLGVVLSDQIVFIDDTGMPVLDKTKPAGKFRGHLWAFKGSTTGMVAFQFTETWKATEIQPWIEAVTGFIQVDDYKGYSANVESILEQGKRVVLVPDDRRLGCMMHVRRRFYDAFKLGDKRASAPLQWLRKIYKVEAEAKELQLDALGRHALRQEKSLPLLRDFNTWVIKMKPNLGKTSKLAQAVRYASNQRVYVDRCFTDGRFEIDNGEIERVLKKPCIGRKNYLHCGSVQGAKRLAAAYTLVMSCKALGLNVNEYLVDVITKLSSGWKLSRIGELVPNAWAAARAKSAPANPPSQ